MMYQVILDYQIIILLEIRYVINGGGGEGGGAEPSFSRETILHCEIQTGITRSLARTFHFFNCDY